MARYRRALRVLALLLGLQQAVAHAGSALRWFGCSLLPSASISRAQRLDLALARQRALLRLAAAQHAHPAGAEPFAAARVSPPRRRPAAASSARADAEVLGDADASPASGEPQPAPAPSPPASRPAPTPAIAAGDTSATPTLAQARRARRPAFRRNRRSPLRASCRARFRPRFPSRLRRPAPRPGAAAIAGPAAFSQSSATFFSWPSAACCSASSDASRPRAAWICLRVSDSSACICALLFLQLGQRGLACFQRRWRGRPAPALLLIVLDWPSRPATSASAAVSRPARSAVSTRGDARRRPPAFPGTRSWCARPPPSARTRTARLA